MRVLLYAGVDLSLPGGVETHVKALATELEARGHTVEILGRPAVLPPFTMVDRVEAARYDVLHHHDGVWPRGVPADARYVRTLHFCVAAKVATYLRIGRLRTLANVPNYRAVAEERAAARRPGRFIAVSARVGREFERWHGLDPRRTSVIPNGVTFAPPAVSREAWRMRHDVPKETFVLVTIGRADFVKGFDLLARAWRKRNRARRALWVTVGGAAPSRTEDTLVTGPVPHGDVLAWIGAADAGAFPSRYEGCGVALLEMLAGGLFALSHDVGIAPEVIRVGENGRIVAMNVAAWRAALDELLASSVPRAPRALDDAYAWPTLAARVEAVYRAASMEAGR